MGTVVVGSYARSYDFTCEGVATSLDHYVEGEVVAIGPWEGCGSGCPHFHIRVTRDVNDGQEVVGSEALPSRVGITVYPPVSATEGLVMEVQRPPAPAPASVPTFRLIGRLRLPGKCDRCGGEMGIGAHTVVEPGQDTVRHPECPKVIVVQTEMQRVEMEAEDVATGEKVTIGVMVPKTLR
ncbi:MAG: hypothetical protein Q8R28_23865, partial [Dehalococcoidia bacterium]|nr:hypothetical protein [Dehalococcoidia bacterium]